MKGTFNSDFFCIFLECFLPLYLVSYPFSCLCFAFGTDSRALGLLQEGLDHDRTIRDGKESIRSWRNEEEN